MLCDDKFSNPVSSSFSISADKMGFFQYFSIVVLYQYQGSDIYPRAKKNKIKRFEFFGCKSGASFNCISGAKVTNLGK